MSSHFKPVLSGFEHVKRFWDGKRHKVVAKVLPGEFYVSKSDELITTVLGSCIAACIYDEGLGIGGMNHFMLPVNKGTSKVAELSDFSTEMVREVALSEISSTSNSM